MNISEHGIEFIKDHAPCNLLSCKNRYSIFAIGYFHTFGVYPDQTIKLSEAERLLRADLASVDNCIQNTVVSYLTQNQYDAVASFTFCLGCMALKKSELLRKINAGDIPGAAEQFKRWVGWNDGKEMDMTKWRADEALLFSQQEFFQ